LPVAKKRIRIIKKVRESAGWKFISLGKVRGRYVWDKRPGYYFVEWWDGKKRRRQLAGQVPSEALETQRRKQNELIGELAAQGKELPAAAEERSATTIDAAMSMFVEHVRVHSPGKPETVRRYQQVLGHFQRHLEKKKYVEAITRSDIDDYKIKRSQELSERHGRRITPRTINFELGTLRTFFYYLINERGIAMANPCARFKPLRDEKKKALRKPPTYSQNELDLLFAVCNDFEKTVFATLLLTGLRKRELYYLIWSDVNLKECTICVTAKPDEGFSPKDYEERPIPMPPDLVALLKNLPRKADWVFCNAKGGRINHLLRRLKGVAVRAGVPNATLHKFRHTYATQLLESGCDIVTLQHLMGHSDLETTRQYLNPNEDLKRKAVNKLSLKLSLKSGRVSTATGKKARVA